MSEVLNLTSLYRVHTDLFILQANYLRTFQNILLTDEEGFRIDLNSSREKHYSGIFLDSSTRVLAGTRLLAAAVFALAFVKSVWPFLKLVKFAFLIKAGLRLTPLRNTCCFFKSVQVRQT